MCVDIKKIDQKDTWEIRQKVMWPDQPIDFIKLENDHEGIHYGLFKNNKLVSIVSLFIKDNQAQFRKFATIKSEQGKGLGSQLLNFLFQELSNYNIEKIWCNARTEKAYFYKKFGLQETNQTYTKGGIQFVIMEKRIQS